MYALQYVLHSLCGGGYYNMRVPNIPVSNRHERQWGSDAAGLVLLRIDQPPV